MKKAPLLLLLLAVGLAGLAQEAINVKAGTLTVETQSGKQRLRNEDGTSECGCYIRSTKTFVSCAGVAKTVEDETMVVPAADCCEKITLSAGVLALSGSLSFSGATATISNGEATYTLSIADNKDALKKLNNIKSKSVSLVAYVE